MMILFFKINSGLLIDIKTIMFLTNKKYNSRGSLTFSFLQ